jgi:hypothetical protein
LGQSKRAAEDSGKPDEEGAVITGNDKEQLSQEHSEDKETPID